MSARPFLETVGKPADPRGELLEVEFFIRLRWLAIAGVAAALAALGFVSRPPPSALLPLWATAAVLLASNVVYAAAADRVRDARSFVLVQMAADLLLLTCLLHFSGGIENPAVLLYVFHVILAGILLPRGGAWGVALGAMGLYSAMVFGEYRGWLDHYDSILLIGPAGELGAQEFSRLWPAVAGISGAFLAVLGGTAYFTTAIMARLRENQAWLVRSERLSALGQVSAFIAHEVSSPLQIISSRSKLLRGARGEDAAFLRESLDIIDRQADRAGSVVRSLLGLSKGRTPPGDVDLNRAVSEALVIASGKLSKSGVQARPSLAEELPPVAAASESDLIHVFLNLINNAVDAMPAGGSLEIHTRRKGGAVEAEVADTGRGMSEEELSRLFEPFFTTKREGSGLGLALSRSLVRAAGGEIEARSVLNAGSRFVVRLPCRERAVHAA